MQCSQWRPLSRRGGPAAVAQMRHNATPHRLYAAVRKGLIRHTPRRSGLLLLPCAPPRRTTEMSLLAASASANPAPAWGVNVEVVEGLPRMWLGRGAFVVVVPVAVVVWAWYENCCVATVAG